MKDESNREKLGQTCPRWSSKNLGRPVPGGVHKMKKNYAFLGIIILCCSSCSPAKPVKFEQSLLDLYPSEPELFQKKYGGELKIIKADNTLLEKTANIEKAYIKGDGFEVFFWYQQKFFIKSMRFEKNRIPIGGIEVINLNSEEIRKIFGQPNDERKDVLIYQDGEVVMTLGLKDDKVVRCYFGFQD